MNWGGILAGAIGGGAQAVQQQAQGYIDDERKLNVAAELSRMEEEKANRLADANIARTEASDLRLNDPTSPHQQYRLTNKKAELQATSESDIARDRAIVAGRLKAEREDVVAKGGDKAYLDATKKIKMANVVPPQMSPLESYNLNKIKKIDGLRDKMAALAADDPQRDTILQQINDLSGTTPKDKNALLMTMAKYDSMEKGLAEAKATALTPEDKVSIDTQIAEIRFTKELIKQQLGYPKSAPAAKPAGSKVDPAMFDPSARKTPAPSKPAGAPAKAFGTTQGGYDAMGNPTP